MLPFQIAPVAATLLLWISAGHCQYDPYYGDPPYYGEPQQPYGQYSPGGQQQPPQYNNYQQYNNQNQNPYFPGQSQQHRIQGYPNLPQFPFQTVTPNPNQRVDSYPFPQQQQTFGNNNPGVPNSNPQNQYFPGGNIVYNLNPQAPNDLSPGVPNFPFQTVQPGGGQPPVNNRMPSIRVIEYPEGAYFEYGGGRLIQPKRPNSDLYIGGVGGDAPITSKIFIECTGPNQVEWSYNGTERRALSVTTKPFQITIPEERGPSPGSREYTYLRFGLENQISERETGVYICRDRILPQNYISIRINVAKAIPKGKPNYPFIPDPKDTNKIYFSRNDNTVLLPCTLNDESATISLHKHEAGKLSCPYPLDGRVSYDRFKGFTLQTKAFNNIEGRYVCVGDFDGDLKLMKYTLVANEGFTTRYMEGEAQNIVALDGQEKSASSSTSFLAEVDPDFSTAGLNSQNLTAAGVINPRSEFDDETFVLKPDKKTSNSTKSASKPV